MIELNYLKYILVILGCLIYLIFFSKSAKHSKTHSEREESRYVSKETENTYFDIHAFFAKLGAIIMIIWSLYELYKCFVA